MSVIPCETANALGAGATTCGQYVRTNQRSRAVINQWILGYATGANEVGQLVFRQDFISGMGQKTLFANVADYCRRNPSISLQNAAQDFLEFVRQSASQQ
jgi:hypothetical protein